MVKLFIDDIAVEVKEGTTILEAAGLAKADIPTLCCLKDINEVGACRLCVVEQEGSERLVTSCNTPVKEGMRIHTNSERVRISRRTNLELILLEHGGNCSTCEKDGNCKLQAFSRDLGVRNIYSDSRINKNIRKLSDIMMKDDSKCIKCLRCISICEKIQGLNVWELRGSGAHTKVTAKDKKNLSTLCSFCGQCVKHCPASALSIRDDTAKFFDAINDPSKIVVVQTAPAVRTAWAEEFGLEDEKATEKKMVAAIKALGADYVFDTDFSADLTVIEEGSELAERLNSINKEPFPLFTSCCPGWVRFAKIRYPELVPYLSSAKSPQQMFGTVAKSYFANKKGLELEKIFCVSIMPCTAKKYESNIDEMNFSAQKAVDAVITTREFTRMLKEKCVNIESLNEEEFDSPLGESSGAGVIFGMTGGVAEAALRTLHYVLTGKNGEPDSFKIHNKKEFWQEAEIKIGEKTIKVAAVSGLGNAKRLIEAIKSGRAKYDFAEVMACPGGCVAGGGQPNTDKEEPTCKRRAKLYALDETRKIRFSYQNESVLKLYDEFLKKPLSDESRSLLHTDHNVWKL